MIKKGSILLFDGVCSLCDSFVGFVIRHDRSKKIVFSSLQSDTGKSLLAEYGLPAGYINSVVYIKENKYYTRSSAVLNILKDIGGGLSVFYGFIIVPVFIRDFVYNVIAGSRYRIFGKKESCLTPHASRLTPFIPCIERFSDLMLFRFLIRTNVCNLHCHK